MVHRVFAQRNRKCAKFYQCAAWAAILFAPGHTDGVTTRNLVDIYNNML